MVPGIIIALTWTYGFVIVGIIKAKEGAGRRLFGPTPFWCSISKHYIYLRYVGIYVWTWLTVSLIILLYVALFFIIRRNLDMDYKRPWRLSFHRALPPLPFAK